MSTVVQAVGYGGPENLEVADVAVPQPGPGEVRVAVLAAGANPIDHKIYSGARGTDPSNLPMRIGFEAAGRVTEVGDDASGPRGPISVGDDVIVFQTSGAYAAELVVPGEVVIPKPAGLPWEQAAGLMLTGTTAVHALTVTGVGAGDTVLVHGAAGGVGLMAVQLAVTAGASVVATASERNHPLLRDLGAVPIAYGDGLLERVRAAAPGGVDAALDLVGSDEALSVSRELLADWGRFVTIVRYDLAGQDVKLIGGGPGADHGTELRDAARLQLVDAVDAGTLTVIMARTFPLGEAADAHRALLAGHTVGKISLLP